MQSVDCLIVGQGLAGSLLAYRLIKRGQSVLVIDNAHSGSSTEVAAGLINPITGHRLNITEGFFDYLKTAKSMYWQIERDIGCSIFREIPQTRLIKNAGQAEYLQKRKQQTEYQSLLDKIENTGHWFSDEPKFPHGRIGVSKTFVVDTKLLLFSLRNWLAERNSIVDAKLDHSMLNYRNGVNLTLDGHSIAASQVIFCEGFQSMHNPWLKHLPFKFAKGEILTLSTACKIDRMLSWGKWLVPMGASSAKLGSNFVWNDVSLNKVTETATVFLSELKEMTGVSARILDHEVGIRPSTIQRKPFVGPVSNLKNAYCLNGLGSKGCLIAPHYVDLLCAHLLDKTPIEPELTQWL